MAAGFKSATVNAASVPSTQTDMPSYVDLARIGITTLAEAHSIRVFADSAKTIEWAREIVSVTEMHVKVPSLTSTVTMYVDWDGIRADYAVGDTYGAQNAWPSKFAAVYHKEGGLVALDSTVNGIDGTWGGYLPTNIAGFIGTAQQYNNGPNFTDLGKPASLAFIPADTFTITALVKRTTGGGVVFSKGDNTTGLWNYRIFVTSAGEIVANVGSGRFDSGSFAVVDVWTRVGLRVTVGSFEVIFNGAVVASSSTPVGTAPARDARVLLGAREYDPPDTEEGFFLNGGIDEVHFRNDYESDDELFIEDKNKSAEATFWGTWTTVSGASTPAQVARRGVIMMM